MAKIKFKDIEFGSTDSVHEASMEQGTFFKKVYLDPFNLEDRIFKDGKIIIMGRKGTGKTSFAIHLESNRIPSRFVSIRNYDAHKVEVYLKKVNEEAQRDLSKYLFEWLLLCEFLNLLKDDNSINSFIKTKIDSFFKKNRGKCAIDSLEISETQSKTETVHTASLKDLLSSLKSQVKLSKETNPSFYSLIDDMKAVICELVASSNQNNTYVTFIDEIDQEYASSEKINNDLYNLILSARDLYYYFQQKGIRFYPIVLIRTDIFDNLKYHSQANKIKTSFSVNLKWYDHTLHKEGILTPLESLIQKRFEYSCEKQKLKKDQSFWDSHFAQWDRERSPFKVIADSTLYRPRDLVEYFNVIKKFNGEKYTLSAGDLSQPSRQFSTYMYDEWLGELGAKFTRKQIDLIMAILSKNGSKLDQLKKDLAAQQFENPGETITNLFDYGLIHYKDNGGKYLFSYRTDETEDFQPESYGVSTILLEKFKKGKFKF